METFRRIIIMLMILTSFGLLNAQKTMQHYMKPQGHIGDDIIVCTGTSVIPSYPYVIVSGDDIEPIHEDPPGPVEMSFGEIPYSIETTQTGQVHLKIPINSYASEYEFAPQLSFDYNSGRSSFDFLGKGWTLKGLPIVTRVPKDYFTDGNVEGISMNDNYSFALEGERLIYQDETVDTIRFVGQTSNVKVQFINNQWFNVFYPDGNVATMNCTDSINYYVTKLRQKDGQEIRYSYTSTGNEQKHISSISYGDGKRMVFDYFTPASGVNGVGGVDGIDYYCAGKLFKKRYKLKDITILNDCTDNDTITRYLLWNSGKVESPFVEIDQYFAGGKYYFPMELKYMHENLIDDVYSQTDTLNQMLYNTNPAECVLQRGKFSLYSEGEGFLMFKNKDSYYYDLENNVYKTGYDASGKILVAHKFNTSGGYVKCSTINMGYGFVDAFPVNADGFHGEEIVKINNWKNDDDYERLEITVYSADLDTIVLKNIFYAHDLQANSSTPFRPKTFLTGDFDGDGKVELLIVYHTNTLAPMTHYRLISLDNGQEIKNGYFNDALTVYFPQKYYRDEELPEEDRWNNYKQSDKIFTVDFNGDGKQEIGMVSYSGFNIHEFYNDPQVGVSSGRVCSKSFPSLYDLNDYGMRIGEFNGDGNADILFYLETKNSELVTPTLYKSYLGNGDGNFTLKDSLPYGSYGVYPRAVTVQANSEGMTDIIIDGIQINSSIPCISIKRMRNGMFGASKEISLSDSTAFIYAFLYGECNAGNILTVDNHGIIKRYKHISIPDVNYKLSWLRDSYHNIYNISYRRVYESDEYHPDLDAYQFPYSTFAKGQLVCHEMKKFDTDYNIIENKLFNYGNAVMHQQGLGYIGFDQIVFSDTISERSQVTDYDILLLGSPKRIENYKSINMFSHILTITADRRIQLRNTGMSHYDKASCVSDTTSYTHDLYGNVTLAQTLFSGGQQKTVQFQYINQSNGSINILGLPSKVTTTVTNSNGSVTNGIKYTYNGNYLTTSEKKFFGNDNQVVEEAQRIYDSQNRITQEKTRKYSSPWLTTTFSFAVDNRKPSSLTDPRGWSYDMIYGKFGLLKCYEYNISQQETLGEPIGRPYGEGINGGAQAPDPTPLHYGQETAYEYDEAGNLVCITNSDSTTHDVLRTWVYHSLGFGAKYYVTDSITGQPIVRTYYNSLGQKTRIETQRPDGSYLKVDYVFDSMGRLIKQYEPYKNSNTLFTSFEYDAFDRVVSKTYPDEHSDTYSYNGLTTTSNVNGVSSSKTIDELGNLIGVTDPGGNIAYSMTSDGRPLSINVNSEASTTFEYDAYGRKTALNDPSSGRISYTYDLGGNIATVTDARGKTTTTTYNDFGKPTSSTIGNDMTVTYSYNNYQQPTAVTCSNGNSKQYTYNKYHKLTSETINGFKKSYNYSGGNVVSIGYSLNGTSLGTESYTRTRGTVTAINYGGKTLWQLNGEDDSAMPTAISSSVVATELEYDDMHRVTSRIAETNNSGTFHDMEYEYDAYGNLTRREDGYWSSSEDFDYDNLNRLVSTPAGDISYDGKGNITEHDAAGVFGYASSRPYALSQITLSASGFPTANQTVTFNSMNRPDTISEGNTTALIRYFEDGERSQMTVIKSNGNIVHNYYGNQFTASNYTTPAFEGQKQVLFLGGDAYTAPAAIVREKMSGTNTWSQSLYYIVRDNLGSIVHVVDSTGVVAQELSYDAWGRLRAPVTQQTYAPGEQPELLLGRGYCGHEHLADFSLINMNARLYDPWTARFLSPDPYVQLPDFTQSLNRYSYCLNNPFNYVDLNGKVWLYSESGGRTYYFFDESIHDNNDLRIKYGQEANLNLLDEDDCAYYFVLLRNNNNENIGEIGLTSNGDIFFNEREVIDVNVGNVYFCNLKNYKFGDNTEAWNMFFRTFYVGADNPQYNNKDTYSLPPINELDEAAFQHDMDYDNLGVNGIKGVLSAKTLVADWNLTRRSFTAMHHYKSSSSPEHSVALCTGVAFAAITATKIRLLLTPSISIIYIIASMLF